MSTNESDVPADGNGEGDNTPQTPEVSLESIQQELNRLKQQNESLVQSNRTLNEQVKSHRDTITEISRRSGEIDPEEAKNRFYSDPYTTVRDIIRNELVETIKPLQEFVSTYKNETELDKMINKVGAHPSFNGKVDDTIRNGVRELFGATKGQEVNEDNVRAAVIQVIGLRSLGLYGSPTVTQPSNNPSNNEPRRSEATPPHVTATPLDTRRKQDKKQVRELTELEKRIARERGMSAEEFIQWNDIGPGDVANSTIGKETNNGS